MSNLMNRFVSDERGLETVEYAIVAGLIVTGVIVTVGLIATWLSGRWTTLKTQLGA